MLRLHRHTGISPYFLPYLIPIGDENNNYPLF